MHTHIHTCVCFQRNTIYPLPPSFFLSWNKIWRKKETISKKRKTQALHCFKRLPLEKCSASFRRKLWPHSPQWTVVSSQLFFCPPFTPAQQPREQVRVPALMLWDGLHAQEQSQWGPHDAGGPFLPSASPFTWLWPSPHHLRRVPCQESRAYTSTSCLKPTNWHLSLLVSPLIAAQAHLPDAEMLNSVW